MPQREGSPPSSFEASLRSSHGRLAHLVAESLVRHGFQPTFDHRRLQWSNWFRCQDSFSLVLAPCKPGLFALGEEVIAPGELGVSEGKRMLALFQIAEANDLGMALGRLFLSSNPARERFASGRCFARYVVIEDASQRRRAYGVTALDGLLSRSRLRSSASHFRRHPITPDNHVAPDALVRGAEQSAAGSRFTAHISRPQGQTLSGPRSNSDAQEAGFVSGHDFSITCRHRLRIETRHKLVSAPDEKIRMPAGPDTELVSGQDNESVSRARLQGPYRRPNTRIRIDDFSSCRNAAISTTALAAALQTGRCFANTESSNKQAQIGPPMPIPSGF